MNIGDIGFGIICMVAGALLGIHLITMTSTKKESHKFIVTDMVQCKGNICNAVLEMDDIAILLPYDSTKVHVGDTLYIVK